MPKTPLNAGFTDVGGYVLAFVNNTAYDNPKHVQVYWTGVRYTVETTNINPTIGARYKL